MDNRTIPRLFFVVSRNDERYMKTDALALSNAVCRGGGNNPPDVGFVSKVLPETIHTGVGVSSGYAQKENHYWFVLRATYGRSEQAYDDIMKDNVEAYIPKHYVLKQINGKKKRILEPLLPNLLFVYATEEYIHFCLKKISYLRYYRNRTLALNPKDSKHPPLTVNHSEMINFIRLTNIDDEHIKMVDTQLSHYKNGDWVRIIDGKFKGITGRVARISGQQRVVVEVEGLCLLATAYIPSAFIEKI